MNWYAYCGNNPVNFVDPTGMYTTIYTHSGENFYGHVAINVNGTVYSFGRFSNRKEDRYAPSGLRGAGVLQTNSEAEYLNVWSKNSDVSSFSLNLTKEQEQSIVDFFNNKIKNGTPHYSIDKNGEPYFDGTYIGTYNVYSNNCTTLTIESLPSDWLWKIGLVDIWTPLQLEARLGLLDYFTKDITYKGTINGASGSSPDSSSEDYRVTACKGGYILSKGEEKIYVCD